MSMDNTEPNPPQLGEMIEILRRMEVNQQRSIALTEEHLAFAKQKVVESVALQKTAISRQKNALRVVWLVLALAVLGLFLIVKPFLLR